MIEHAEHDGGRIFVVANLKGGVGKSSIAANLACFLAEKGGTSTVDLDVGQQDLSRFSTMRGIRSKVIGETAELIDYLQERKALGETVVVDCPPGERDTTKAACYLATAVIMPVRPGANDAQAIGRLLSMVGEIREARNDLKVFSVCNFYKNSKEASAMVDILRQIPNATFAGKLWDRKDYSVSIADAVPVWEVVPGKPAALEMRALCEALERVVR
jgi:chromosome partitioning protein